jgi:hypothetical protein
LIEMPQNENATEKVAFYFTLTQTHTLTLDCGGGGIRTPEGFYTLPVFKTGAINRSTTPPGNFISEWSANIESFEFSSLESPGMKKVPI